MPPKSTRASTAPISSGVTTRRSATKTRQVEAKEKEEKEEEAESSEDMSTSPRGRTKAKSTKKSSTEKKGSTKKSSTKKSEKITGKRKQAPEPTESESEEPQEEEGEEESSTDSSVQFLSTPPKSKSKAPPIEDNTKASPSKRKGGGDAKSYYSADDGSLTKECQLLKSLPQGITLFRAMNSLVPFMDLEDDHPYQGAKGGTKYFGRELQEETEKAEYDISVLNDGMYAWYQYCLKMKVLNGECPEAADFDITQFMEQEQVKLVLEVLHYCIFRIHVHYGWMGSVNVLTDPTTYGSLSADLIKELLGKSLKTGITENGEFNFNSDHELYLKFFDSNTCRLLRQALRHQVFTTTDTKLTMKAQDEEQNIFNALKYGIPLRALMKFDGFDDKELIHTGIFMKTAKAVMKTRDTKQVEYIFTMMTPVSSTLAPTGARSTQPSHQIKQLRINDKIESFTEDEILLLGQYYGCRLALDNLKASSEMLKEELEQLVTPDSTYGRFIEAQTKKNAHNTKELTKVREKILKTVIR